MCFNTLPLLSNKHTHTHTESVCYLQRVLPRWGRPSARPGGRCVRSPGTRHWGRTAAGWRSCSRRRRAAGSSPPSGHTSPYSTFSLPLSSFVFFCLCFLLWFRSPFFPRFSLLPFLYSSFLSPLTQATTQLRYSTESQMWSKKKRNTKNKREKSALVRWRERTAPVDRPDCDLRERDRSPLSDERQTETVTHDSRTVIEVMWLRESSSTTGVLHQR